MYTDAVGHHRAISDHESSPAAKASMNVATQSQFLRSRSSAPCGWTRRRALQNTDVKVAGQTVTDNAQIPGALRGYVQIALDKGLIETFPRKSGRSGRASFRPCRDRASSRRARSSAGEFITPATKLLKEMYVE